MDFGMIPFPVGCCSESLGLLVRGLPLFLWLPHRELITWQLAPSESVSKWEERGGRESEWEWVREREIKSYNLISGATFHYFCWSLFVKGKSPSPSHSQKKRQHEVVHTDQKVGVLGAIWESACFNSLCFNLQTPQMMVSMSNLPDARNCKMKMFLYLQDVVAC